MISAPRCPRLGFEGCLGLGTKTDLVLAVSIASRRSSGHFGVILIENALLANEVSGEEEEEGDLQEESFSATDFQAKTLRPNID